LPHAKIPNLNRSAHLPLNFGKNILLITKDALRNKTWVYFFAKTSAEGQRLVRPWPHQGVITWLSFYPEPPTSRLFTSTNKTKGFRHSQTNQEASTSEKGAFEAMSKGTANPDIPSLLEG
jgi:hypothetical protein